MNRTRILITVVAFLATFAWLLVPDLKASPAVLWPSVLAVGLAFVTRDIYLSLFLGRVRRGIAPAWRKSLDRFPRPVDRAADSLAHGSVEHQRAGLHVADGRFCRSAESQRRHGGSFGAGDGQSSKPPARGAGCVFHGLAGVLRRSGQFHVGRQDAASHRRPRRSVPRETGVHRGFHVGARRGTGLALDLGGLRNVRHPPGPRRTRATRRWPTPSLPSPGSS